MTPNDTTPNDNSDAPNGPNTPSGPDAPNGPDASVRKPMPVQDDGGYEYESLRLDDGDVIVYVPENPDEWVQSDVAVPLPDLA